MRWQEEQAEDIPCPVGEEEDHPVAEDRWEVMQEENHPVAEDRWKVMQEEAQQVAGDRWEVPQTEVCRDQAAETEARLAVPAGR
ncbi:MAG: hypothetical protein LIO94_05670 [Clostridiales bacterium]|nr:hypothetical protein [Clostridiales bacterium]